MDDAEVDDRELYGYKLLLVPMGQIRALSRGIPQLAVIGGGTFEVVADVDGDDLKIRAGQRRLRDMIGDAEPALCLELREAGGRIGIRRRVSQ